jgi:hypothetical protein
MKLPFNINAREKVVLLLGAVLASFIIIYWLFAWYGDLTGDVSDLADAKLMMLEKQMVNISEMQSLQDDMQGFRNEASRQEKALLKGDKPPVAAAELQSLLKNMISSLDIDMRAERTLGIVDVGHYIGIPVEIGFISDTGKLKSFLYKLRGSSLLLNVSVLKVRVTNLNNPKSTYVTVVITGYIRKTPEEGRAERG